MAEQMPKYDDLLKPTVNALVALGGSASNQELEDQLVSDLGLTAELAEAPHGDGRGTELGYRAAWARTYLKFAGLINNSERGIWSLAAEAAKSLDFEPAALVAEARRRRRAERTGLPAADGHENEESDDGDWASHLLSVLQDMDPIAFERLCQRVLRESGFIEVEVTKRSGDGGIDGYGTIRIGGLISFPVLFQSKRYQGSIGPDMVRDFRGAMAGRADKGLIITTGGFTREARKEATRDGAPPIDLIDGELLTQKLKELRLGLTVTMVEHVEVDEDWFASI